MKTRTVSEIVEALGGKAAVAELCGVGITAVVNWCSWNRLPRHQQLPLLVETRRRGISVPDSLIPGASSLTEHEQPEHAKGAA